MKVLLTLCLFYCFIQVSFAQEPSLKEMHQSAKWLMQQGDYEKAEKAFTKVLAIEPDNAEVLKDYMYFLCLQKEYEKAIVIGKSLTEKPDADVQAYQILGFAYKGSGNVKECAKLYQIGLTKFPNSGVLYNEYGELLARDNNLPIAILEWEAGIKVDPNYSSNYYNATMYYTRVGTNLCWVLLYGEAFINLESYTQRTADIKSILLDGYTKLFTTFPLEAIANDVRLNLFEKAFYQTLIKSKLKTNTGINAECLTAMRTRFILNWIEQQYAEKLPFHLFDSHLYLLREGMFGAYNQWIFGAAASPSAYQYWINTHDKEAKAFKDLQKNKIYKIPSNQYYKL